ncbi:hypothetical protein ACFPMF_20735 [Larkinella bovis]|uniref:Collagen-like protein n=1 Tax=Larkinella bovis TaxID=683041 RepID=A0ABW0IEB5_9BACT
MKIKLSSSVLSLLTMGILFMGCKGDEGPVGPAGAKGDTGAQGVAGPKGEPGTANVIYSEWLPLPEKAVASNPNRKNFDIPAPKITQEILDKGLVYAYLKHSAGTVTPLPYANRYVFSDGTVSGSYLTTIIPHVGRISLNQDWMTPGTIPTNFADATSVQGGYTHLRYVVVPGGIPAGRQAAIDYSNYETVKATYHLPD